MATTRLLKALTAAGFGSRRNMAEDIKQGRISVNGNMVSDFKYPVDTSKDRITMDGKPVSIKAKEFVYLILHKPKGVLSTTRDDRGGRTVIDLLPEEYKSLGLYPLGRLDKDSTGLLILTNDGDLTYRLSHPRFEKEKEYLIRLDHGLTSEDKVQLEQGIELEDGLTYPAIVRKTKENTAFNYDVVIHEGRKRQLRRMFQHLGYQVLALKRIRLGNLHLGSLPEGQTRQLSSREVDLLLEANKHQ
jgi:23S rRNA pseudouridine2605 synthase